MKMKSVLVPRIQILQGETNKKHGFPKTTKYMLLPKTKMAIKKKV